MEELRDKAQSALILKFKKLYMYSKNAEQIAKNIEISIYNETLKQSQEIIDDREKNEKVMVSFDFKKYREIFRKVLFCLTFKDQFAQTVQDRIKRGDLNIMKIASMSKKDLDFGHTIDAIHKKYDYIYIRGQRGKEMKKLIQGQQGQSLFPCRSCKSKNTEFIQLQTRSADESMTVRVECNDCGRVFKIN